MQKLMLATLMMLPAFAEASDPVPPPEDLARTGFQTAATAAETAYRNSVLNAMRVLESRLAELERDAVKRSDLQEGNDVRAYRDRMKRLAAIVERQTDLGGMVPRIHAHGVPTSASHAVNDCKAKLAQAGLDYRAALTDAKFAAAKILRPAMESATESGDLDAANRVKASQDAIETERARRSRALGYDEYRCDSLASVQQMFLLKEPDAWRVVDGELIGTERYEEELEATLAWSFEQFTSVTVRGRIRKNAKHNFRINVGPVNLIFNWECARQCHFRYYDDCSVIEHNLLTPGKEHDITVRQKTRDSIEVLVDGSPVWTTPGRLYGTITIYTTKSSIGVRELSVLGKKKGPLDRETGKPSHRRW